MNHQTHIACAADRLTQEVDRRRTFAIISHPDAGKTTLTEKLLLYAGAIEQAGAVRGRKHQRQVISDWMSMEQERGISITSTVLQFAYEEYLFNLLDTPGHQDFSEDTYRTLMAVDSAVMVLDSAKGIEAQTQKLFTVCRQQALPILTFINKLDRPGRDPLELLDEIEQTLSIQAVPMNWPIGNGPDFQGVYDRQHQQVLCFQRTTHGRARAPIFVTDWADPELAELLGPRVFAQAYEDVELLTAVGLTFEQDAFLAGELTPVYFGSALNNFGIEPFLAALIDLAPPPGARRSDQGLVSPHSEHFTGFIFKIQANMDPKHRDSMAFLRICSGRFAKDMSVYHPRLARTLRISRPHRLFAQGRETVDIAYPGDVIGLSNPGLFAIGDTVTGSEALQFAAIPSFPPEHFARLRNRNIEKFKQFNKGLAQLVEEAVVQVLYPQGRGGREPILAAVGTLQFDVVTARLKAEYNVDTDVEPLPYATARWVTGCAAKSAAQRWPQRALVAQDQRWPQRALVAQDRHGATVILFTSQWEMNHCIESHPQIEFHETAPNGHRIEQ